MNNGQQEELKQIQEKQDEKVNFFEKTKAKISDTTIKGRILFSVFVFGLVVVIFSALINLVLDPDVFVDDVKRNAWLVRTTVLIAITTFGIVIGEQLFLDMLLRKKDGAFQVSAELYKQHRSKALIYYNGYVDWFIWFKAETLRQKKLSFLIGEGVDDAIKFIDYIDEIIIEEEVEEVQIKKIKVKRKTLKSELLNHSIKLSNGQLITKKTVDQLTAIKYVQDGNILIDTFSPNYYITREDAIGEAFTIEEGKLLDKLEKKDVWFRRISKILSIAFSSTLLTLATASDFINVTDVQAWLNLLSRVFALFGALGSGAMTANRIKEIRIKKMDNKTTILLQFTTDIETKRFVPMSYDEKARKELVTDERYNKDESIDNREQELPVVPYATSNT